ncbi:hypothetical protein MATL_G00151680 [Megalops atlanticus]|uniref:Serpin domain-containing protein n=1 Tax=Megalops atlanticus TaxID=7932 RepID=A0A9D3T584_MEGAT|nr:hypothetical protein MATL_G00151680 [Megalops atlanticus]
MTEQTSIGQLRKLRTVKTIRHQKWQGYNSKLALSDRNIQARHQTEPTALSSRYLSGLKRPTVPSVTSVLWTHPLPAIAKAPATQPHAAMCRLSMTSLFICLWLVRKSHGGLGDTLGELHTEFAVSLYQTLTETDNNSNLIVSPVSISVSLGLLQFGARGNTLSQLEGALRYNSNEVRMQDFLMQVPGDTGNSSQAVRVQLACALFVESGMQLSPAFTQHASAWGNSSVFHTNFSQPNHTRSQMEQWIRSHGNGEAHALPPGGDVLGLAEPQGDPPRWGQSQMALVTTVAFRGTWQKQFLFADTQNLPFTLSDGTTIKVPMMYQASEVNFGQFRTPTDHRYTVVELPYLGESLSLLVALPSDRKVPLSQLELQVSPHAVGLWASGLRRTKMDVFLPR